MKPLWPKLNVDAIVVNLGINDARLLGDSNGPGYAAYGPKIDWMMNQVPAPTFPSTGPICACSLEPPTMLTGCQTVDIALSTAKSRWPNLSVLPWATTAKGHPEYMLFPGTNVHYSPPGDQAWADLVLAALDARFP